MKFNALIPELTVSDLKQTKNFYTNVLGFRVEYERKEDGFAFLSLEDNQIMFEQYHEDGWNTAELVKPFGRGVNFEMGVSDVEQFYEKVVSCGVPRYRELKTNVYQTEDGPVSQKEFLLMDPDGFLLRFTEL